MSDQVLPWASLPGMSFSVFKIPTWSRRFQRAVSGREIVSQDYVNPIWEFRLPFTYLHDFPFRDTNSEYRLLLNFYNAMLQSGDTFLFLDPTDFEAGSVPIGTGDGTETAYQLVKFWLEGGSGEHVTAIENISEITVDGTPTLDYAIDPGTGIVTFNDPPPLGAAITASFTYYFRCRFSKDSADFRRFANGFWALDELRFRSVLL